MTIIRNNNPSYLALLRFWKKHCLLEKWHIDWLKQNIEVIPALSKDEILYLEGERQKNLYFVSRGALARIRYDSNYKIYILSLALPEMAMMSTAHLYSHTPSIGNIIVLRSNTRVVRISYKAIKSVQHIPEMNTLISILNNKKKKQLAQLRILSTINSATDRYLYFIKNLKDLKTQITHKEVVQLLGISKASIFRATNTWRNK